MKMKIKVLVVDDNDDVRYTIKQSLKSMDEDYNVIEAADGSQCVEKAKSEKPDIILLDIMMPDIDGQQVAVQLKEFPETKKIPIIFLTAKTDPLSKNTGKMIGDDYITKPFVAKDLDKRIKAQLK